MTKLIAGLVVFAGLINFLPVLGLLSASRLQALYGIELADPNLVVLMRHRALLFGLLGGFMIWSAFHQTLLPAAFVMGFTSMIGFIVIAWQTGGYNAALSKVVLVDWVAIAALGIAYFLYLVPGVKD